jgi:hypothetical protein
LAVVANKEKKKKKKKGKNKQLQAHQNRTLTLRQSDLRSVLDGIMDGQLSPFITFFAIDFHMNVVVLAGRFPSPCPQSLMNIFQRLSIVEQGFTDAGTDSDIDLCQTLSVIHGSFRAALLELSSLLDTIISITDSKGRREKCVLDTVDTLLDHLVSTVLGLLARVSKRIGKVRDKTRKRVSDGLSMACDEIFGGLSEKILIPVVRALGPLSKIYISTILGTGKEKETEDIRIGLIELIDGVMIRVGRTTREFQEEWYPGCGVNCLRMRVVLESLRGLIDVYSVGSIEVGERNRRMGRLGRKDAVWLWCDVLHVIFGSDPAADHNQESSTENKMLREEVENKMVELMKKMGREGEMEKSMVLGVIERGWMNSLKAKVPSCSQW